MRHKVAVKEERKDRNLASCQHYWIIESAHGPESHGVCKHCGEEKDFPNSMPDFSNYRNNKRHGNPLELPKMEGVDVEEESLS